MCWVLFATYYLYGQVQVIWPHLDSGFLRGSESIAYLTKLLQELKDCVL